MLMTKPAYGGPFGTRAIISIFIAGPTVTLVFFRVSIGYLLKFSYSDLRWDWAVMVVLVLNHVSGTTSSCLPMLPKHTDEEYRIQGIHDPTPKKSALVNL